MTAAPRLSTPPPGQERRWCHVAGCTAEPRYGYHVFLNGKRADEIHVCAAHRAQGEAAWRARSGRDLKLPDPDAAVPDRWGKELFGGSSVPSHADSSGMAKPSHAPGPATRNSTLDGWSGRGRGMEQPTGKANPDQSEGGKR
jgi:hypothetical protein